MILLCGHQPHIWFYQLIKLIMFYSVQILPNVSQNQNHILWIYHNLMPTPLSVWKHHVGIQNHEFLKGIYQTFILKKIFFSKPTLDTPFYFIHLHNFPNYSNYSPSSNLILTLNIGSIPNYFSPNYSHRYSIKHFVCKLEFLQYLSFTEIMFLAMIRRSRSSLAVFIHFYTCCSDSLMNTVHLQPIFKRWEGLQDSLYLHQWHQYICLKFHILESLQDYFFLYIESLQDRLFNWCSLKIKRGYILYATMLQPLSLYTKILSTRKNSKNRAKSSSSTMDLLLPYISLNSLSHTWNLEVFSATKFPLN